LWGFLFSFFFGFFGGELSILGYKLQLQNLLEQTHGSPRSAMNILSVSQSVSNSSSMSGLIWVCNQNPFCYEERVSKAVPYIGSKYYCKTEPSFPSLTSTLSQSPFCAPKKGLIIIIIKVLFDHHHLLLHHHSSLIYSFHSHSTTQSLNRKKQEMISSFSVLSRGLYFVRIMLLSLLLY
jgi:hypothetical protein